MRSNYARIRAALKVLPDNLADYELAIIKNVLRNNLDEESAVNLIKKFCNENFLNFFYRPDMEINSRLSIDALEKIVLVRGESLYYTDRGSVFPPDEILGKLRISNGYNHDPSNERIVYPVRKYRITRKRLEDYPFDRYLNEKIYLKELPNLIIKSDEVIFSSFNFSKSEYPTSHNWTHSDLIALRINNGMSINECLNCDLTQKALLIFKNEGHSRPNTDYTIVFEIPYIETSITHLHLNILRFWDYYGVENRGSELIESFKVKEGSQIVSLDKEVIWI